MGSFSTASNLNAQHAQAMHLAIAGVLRAGSSCVEIRR
jgi:hypothetical protein